MEGNYLGNFIQAIFDALPREEVEGASIVVGGDGRYFVKEAIQTIAKIAFANGVGRLVVGQHGTVIVTILLFPANLAWQCLPHWQVSSPPLLYPPSSASVMVALPMAASS